MHPSSTSTLLRDNAINVGDTTTTKFKAFVRQLGLQQTLYSNIQYIVDTYHIPERFSPTLPGPNDPAVCTPERIVLYTLAFSFCGVRYPLSLFKVELLQHFGIHFSQLHPLLL
ncbi:hypothetical protein Hanom_Chr04g00300921 [Helianthus anomalus]